jgi:hypothetical protein
VSLCCVPVTSPRFTQHAPDPPVVDPVHQIFPLENKSKKSLISHHFAFKPLSLL